MSTIRVRSIPCPDIAPERLAALVTRAVVSMPREERVRRYRPIPSGGEWLAWADGNRPNGDKRVD